MAFTANEMVTAIATTPANMDMADRFERAAFAAFLADQYGAGTETARELLNCFTSTDVWYEDGVVTAYYRELIEFRASK